MRKTEQAQEQISLKTKMSHAKKILKSRYALRVKLASFTGLVISTSQR